MRLVTPCLVTLAALSSSFGENLQELGGEKGDDYENGSVDDTEEDRVADGYCNPCLDEEDYAHGDEVHGRSWCSWL